MSRPETRSPTDAYDNGTHYQNSPTYRGDNDLVVLLSQLVGKNALNQPELLRSVNGSLLTAQGAQSERSTCFIYYVRGTDTGGVNFVDGSAGKVKKIVTFPVNVAATDIIRVNTFFYHNPVYPTRPTVIDDYEEAASFYFDSGVLKYDINSFAQNNIVPN